jgi:hypothetical protein
MIPINAAIVGGQSVAAADGTTARTPRSRDIGLTMTNVLGLELV